MTNDIAPTPEDPDRFVQRVLQLVHQLGQFADDVFRNSVPLKDLTPRQYILLQTIEQNPGISQTGLVKRTGVDRSTLADIIRRLKAKKLVERARHRRDARMYVLRLTELGRQVLIDARPSVNTAVQEFLAPLPKDQQANFIANLARISAASKSSQNVE